MAISAGGAAPSKGKGKGVELGVGYVSLTVSAKGMKESVEAEVKQAKIPETVETAGEQAGTKFGDGFKAKLSNLKTKVSDLNPFGKKDPTAEGEDAGTKFGTGFKSKLALATRIGGGIANQLLENADIQAKVIEGALALIQAFSEGGIAGAFDLVKEKAQPVIDLFNKHKELFTFVGIAIAVVLVPALYAWAVSAGAAAIATLGLTWPVLAIAVAVGALAAGVVYAYTHWGFFRNAVDAVAGFLKDTLWPILKSVGLFLSDNLVPIIKTVAGWFAGQFVDSIKQVAGLFSDLWNAGVEMKDQLVSAFNATVDFVKELPGRLLEAGKGMWDFITQPFEDAMNGIRKLWNDTVGGFTVEIPSWIPVFGGNSFTIPKLHSGGVVPGPPGSEHLYLLQAGETVIPAGTTRDAMGPSPVSPVAGQQGGINIGVLNTQPRPLLEQFIELQHLMPAA